MLKAIASIVSITSIILLNPTNISAQTQDFNANSYQKNTNNSLIAQTMPRLRFKLPDRGVPGARIGGATRSGDKSTVVTAIIPPEKLALTIDDSPTIFVYLPKNDAFEANIKVVEENGKEIYTKNFTPPNEAGVLRVKLPANINLEEKKLYKWEIQLISEDDNPLTAFKLRTVGWLEKVSLPEEMQQEITTDKEWDSLNTLAEAGIWYDTLEGLALLRAENPQDNQIKKEWVELLNSVGLDSIAEISIFPEVVQIN
ncbi:DUF928 domain-containing protein [Cyanobacterium aponinum]|uniref:DUF928 domain-containing protein n=1 Tax=Cyanobacterium aponinum (strain PCC 10605) TaxID=755178 RepID=K9Z4B1_CYAAP|nr:DUF928 domain-containing protein [Cyanobacterium aponinum]AFZ53582.1 protein of unknown function DUF928 [Cyanobacterium aponinum PCC 10605]